MRIKVNFKKLISKILHIDFDDIIKFNNFVVSTDEKFYSYMLYWICNTKWHKTFVLYFQ